jgi:hypothetical protein
MEDHHLSEFSFSLGSPIENSNGHTKADANIPLEFAVPGFHDDMDIRAERNSGTEESHSRTNSNEGSTEIFFVRGDGDSDDHFVVDIFTDPKYGTFFFRTTSGLSLCKHEEGTLYPEPSLLYRFRRAPPHQSYRMLL